MELLLTILVGLMIFVIGYFLGVIYSTDEPNERYYPDGYISTAPTSSFNEVPTELLVGGDTERMLHIAGIKEASFEKQKEWADKRKVEVETKTTLSMEDLLNGLDKDSLQLKAGIKQHTHNEEAIKVASKLISIEKDVNPLIQEKLKIEARRKESQKEQEQKIKIDFEALNFSRISNEARKKISEIVKQDLEAKIKEIEKNTPEINDDTQGKTDSDMSELIKKAMLANSPKVLGEYQTKKGSPKIPRTKKQ